MTHYHYVPPNNWTDERVEMLRKLCADGLSAGQMREELGGITRNSIIGKARRMGFGFTSQPGKPKQGPKPRGHRKTPFVDRKPPKFNVYVAIDLPPEQPANPVTLMELTADTCRWPIGEVTHNTMFCGATAVPGAPYCVGHCRIAYARPGTNLDRGERELLIRRMAKMRGAKG